MIVLKLSGIKKLIVYINLRLEGGGGLKPALDICTKLDIQIHIQTNFANYEFFNLLTFMTLWHDLYYIFFTQIWFGE